MATRLNPNPCQRLADIIKEFSKEFPCSIARMQRWLSSRANMQRKRQKRGVLVRR